MIKYIPTFIPSKILIVGAGGTGSRMVPLLGQFLKTCAWIPNPEITIVDDDVVEEKNLLRQNFITPDVGKPKAAVLAQRYSRAFNIPIVPVIQRITRMPDPYVTMHRSKNDKDSEVESSISTLIHKHMHNSIVILCVDSPEARRHIVGRLINAQHNSGVQGPNVLLLDSGNENDFGQVSISTMNVPTVSMYGAPASTLKALPNALPVDVTIPGIPMDITYFRDMVATTTASCADLDQTMAINSMMANLMFSLIQSFYYCKPLTAHRYNVTLANGTMPENITPRFLAKTIDGRYVEKSNFGGYDVNLRAVDYTAAVTELTRAHAELERHKTKAEAEARAAQNAKESKLKEDAVENAMRKYGWKKPGQESATTTEVKDTASKKAGKVGRSSTLPDCFSEKKSSKKLVNWDSDEVFNQLMNLVDES